MAGENPKTAAEYDSNIRAYTIFCSYMLLCISLAVFIIRNLLVSFNSLSPPGFNRRHVLLFSFLATASLCTTWYYMYQYFVDSYQRWVYWQEFYGRPIVNLELGRWLRETELFREAWLAAIVGVHRYWWTAQIFLFACGLGLNLEQKGTRKGIKHTWAFMLLGQVVAISFATNLFLISLLLTPKSCKPAQKDAPRKNKWIGPWLLNFIAVFGTLWPAYSLQDPEFQAPPHILHPPRFLRLLLVPHFVLLLLPIARAVLPTKYVSDEDVPFADRAYNFMWNIVIGGGGMLVLKASAAVWREFGFSVLVPTLFETPAVSSVGWDVIFCWITWYAWWKVQKVSFDDVIGVEGSVEEKEVEVEETN
ncbi:hypothetical protein K469DRAFT_674463 [Zopfia rhizophila CBS 207.26]|uniref:Uncharacterized protein n=1 Tax=Zopfia rhizophila CBS 207.26 TaxID=1314779 RepID=A0A6A6DLG8_9PEZI|nr:hypothetical protein K469DRAFT_674463 [Zopfia rhizophila CBS 207.26]